ncbi:hypothetical protein AVEN_216834-1 [Araneus ventricosus]|uniref:Uncharacterized protein n=1 Tax=Araneus ventricosus TaxID=182803 RepID=A0A4Y2JHB5_ARAVE|nr:hypothetical protein AVEN_216834-1 [Araneus ventricosus]
MKDLKIIETIKPKQVPSSKHQHKRRVHQPRKIRWELSQFSKLEPTQRGDQLKQDAKSSDAQETNKKIAAHPKQISTNIEECISWRLTFGETKWQEANLHRTLQFNHSLWHHATYRAYASYKRYQVDIQK